MARRPALVLAVLLAGAAGLAPTATAAPPGSDATALTAPATHVVQLRSAPLRITPAGGVRVVMWNRCSPGIMPFELSVGVYQDGVTASKTLLAGTDEMPACDGERHRFVVTVPRPVTGSFRPGTAQIDVYVAAYDEANQTDEDASDSTFAELYRPKA